MVRPSEPWETGVASRAARHAAVPALQPAVAGARQSSKFDRLANWFKASTRLQTGSKLHLVRKLVQLFNWFACLPQAHAREVGTAEVFRLFYRILLRNCENTPLKRDQYKQFRILL